MDDCTPCPPTPHCVEDTECATCSGYANKTTTVTTTNQPQRRHYQHGGPSHVSDHLVYSLGIYARPSPALMIIQRAKLDQHGFQHVPINPSTCTEPFKLFSFTAGNIPRTGLNGHDQQTSRYYHKRPYPCPTREPPSCFPFYYPISVIEAVEQSIRSEWFLVYPSPIPVLIIRASDIIGSHALARRLDGFAFVPPIRNTIWSTVFRRGVSSSFRPLDRSATVETSICFKGAAVYWPQHIVASKFAVNVFLELTPASGQPRCEYLGAYILQLLETLTMNSTAWSAIDPEVRHSLCRHIPLRFDGRPPIPVVRFLYYKWDDNILGLADEIAVFQMLAAIKSTINMFDDSDSPHSSDTDSETASNASLSSIGEELLSLI